MSAFLTVQSVLGSADFGPVARDIALNNLYPGRTDATISLLWTAISSTQKPVQPVALAKLISTSNGVTDTALLTLPSGNFLLTNMFDFWKHDLFYPQKVP